MDTVQVGVKTAILAFPLASLRACRTTSFGLDGLAPVRSVLRSFRLVVEAQSTRTLAFISMERTKLRSSSRVIISIAPLNLRCLGSSPVTTSLANSLATEGALRTHLRAR